MDDVSHCFQGTVGALAITGSHVESKDRSMLREWKGFQLAGTVRTGNDKFVALRSDVAVDVLEPSRFDRD